MTTNSSGGVADLSRYEVLVAVCGGISAYKTCLVVSALVQRGAGVTAAMTESATHFVGPLTFEALTARPVMTSLWRAGVSHDPQHISMTERADAFVIAPATANMLAKLACGIADDLVSTLALSVASPMIVAPAMNERMWNNPAVQGNVAVLRERGVQFIGPGAGWQACRTIGKGRMAEAEEIVDAVAAGLLAAPPKTERR